MKTLRRIGISLAAALLATTIVVMSGSQPAASASTGCTYVNALNAGAQGAGSYFGPVSFEAGEVIHFPVSADSEQPGATNAILSFTVTTGDTPQVADTTSLPGQLDWTVPTTGTYDEIALEGFDNNGDLQSVVKGKPTCDPVVPPSTTTTTLPTSSGCNAFNARANQTTSNDTIPSGTFNAGEYIGAVMTLPDGSQATYATLDDLGLVLATAAVPGTLVYQVPTSGQLDLAAKGFNASDGAAQVTFDYFCSKTPVTGTPTTTTSTSTTTTSTTTTTTTTTMPTTTTAPSQLKCSLPVPTGYKVREGTPGNDTIYITSGKWYVIAGDGNDRIIGASGADIICGGNGDDYIDMGSGNDYAEGGPGNDTINGGSGTDTGIDTPGTKMSSIEKTSL